MKNLQTRRGERVVAWSLLVALCSLPLRAVPPTPPPECPPDRICFHQVDSQGKIVCMWTLHPILEPSFFINTVNAFSEPFTVGYPFSLTIGFRIEAGALEKRSIYGTCGDGYISWPGTFGSPTWAASPSANVSPNTGAGFTATFTAQSAGEVTFTLNGQSSLYPWNKTVAVSVPFNPLAQMRLGHWRFNTVNWMNDNGQMPITIQNLYAVSDWNDGAVRFYPASGKLSYPAFQSDGMPNVTRNSGSVRFWFMPAWSSGTGPADGSGQSEFYLFHMQRDNPNNPYDPPTIDSRLVLNPAGNLLTLAVPGASVATPNSISFVANKWYQIVATYSPTAAHMAIYVNGVKVSASATAGVQWMSNPLTKFTIGSSVNGNQTANGTFDELETFNYVLSPTQIQEDYDTARNLDSDGDGEPNLDEIEAGTDPHDPDTDNDGVPDGQDPFPNDPNRWDPPPTSNDHTGPGIILLQPDSALEL